MPLFICLLALPFEEERNNPVDCFGRKRWVRFSDVTLIVIATLQNHIRRASRATFPKGEGFYDYVFSFKYTVANGGIVIAMDCGRLCHGISTVWNSPPADTPEPPYCVSSLLNTSRYVPGSGTPMR